MIDKFLRRLHAEEERRFIATHPRSAVLAKEAQANLLGGVPMAWMTRWPGSFPIFFDTAHGAHFTDVDGLDYIDFCLGDTGAMTGHGLPQVAEALYAQALRGITTMLPSVDAAWVGAELARRFGLPVWQMAMTATDANRFVLRFARRLTGRTKVLVFDWCYHGSVDEALATLDVDGSTISRPGNLGAAFDPSTDNGRRAVQRSRRARGRPGDRRDRLRARRTGAHQHRHRHARPRLPRRAAPAHPRPRHVAGDRRDAHHLRRSGRRDRGLGSGARLLRHRQDDRWRHAGRGLRHDRARSPSELAPMITSSAVDVSGVGGTLTGNALAVAAVRATLSSTLRDEDFAHMIPLATAWTDGVQATIDRHDLPWHVQQLGGRAEYWFCPPPRDGAAAAAAVDDELDAFMHLWAINRGILLTPFHNMALMSPHHTAGRRRRPHRGVRRCRGSIDCRVRLAG